MKTTVINEKGLLATLACIQFIHILDFMVMMPLGLQFMQVFLIDIQQFSYLISAYTISAGIVGFLGSFILDKLERKKTLGIVFLGLIIGTFLSAISSTYIHLLLSRIMTGAFGGLSAALVLSILGDAIPVQRRGRAMGTVMMSFSLASILGVPFALFLTHLFSWKAPFFLIVGMGVGVLFLIALFIPTLNEHIQKESNAPFPFIQTLSDSNQSFALLVTLTLMLGQFSVIPLISTYMTTNVGFSESSLSYLYIFGGIASLLISQISGRLGDRFGKHLIFTSFSVLMLPTLYIITHLTRQSIILPLLVTSALFLTSTGRMVCGMAIIVSCVGPKQRGGFMSMNTAVQQLAAGIAAFIAGAIVTQLPSGELQHYQWVGYWAIVMAIASIYLASRVKSVDATMD